MPAKNSTPYILGLDLGSASLGWALVGLNRDGEPSRLLRTGVRVFDPGVQAANIDVVQQGKDEPKAAKRRQMRLQRRQLRRHAARQRGLFELLQQNSLMPPYPAKIPAGAPHVTNAQRSAARHEILTRLDLHLRDKWKPQGARSNAAVPAPDHVLPYFLRAQSLCQRLEPYELGRALYHLGQRRGFKSNRREAKSAEEMEEKSKVYAGISEIKEQMRAAGAPTLGHFFAGIDPTAGKRIRGRWTARSMFEQEFEAIWNAQQPHHPETLTTELHEQIHQLLFFQRPIARQAHLIGECELEPGRKRAPIACLDAQRFRLLQKVNDLKIRYADFTERYLTAPERTTLLEALQRQGDLTFAEVRRLLGLPKRGVWFNLEKGGEKRLPGNRTVAKMVAAFGDRWFQLLAQDQMAIVEDWRTAESEEWLVRRGMARWGLDEQHARKWAEAPVEDGYLHLSHKALSKLLPMMDDGFPFKEVEKEVYGVHFSGGRVHEQLPPVRKALAALRNPAVERSLTELRKVVNAIVREYGKPAEIHLELARDLKQPREIRKKTWSDMRDRQKLREETRTKIPVPAPSRADIEKALLWEECGGICPYTGKPIPFNELFGDNPQFDVEHILPFSRCPDNSFANKTLCYQEENRTVKRGRTPWEAYGADPERWEEILGRARRFKNAGKVKRFLVKTQDELAEFTSRQLNDTRYASKLSAKYLGLLYGGRDVPRGDGPARQVIFASPGKLTADLRRNWGLEAILREPEPAETSEKTAKPRGDHHHHAIDALVIALSSPAAVKALSDAAERNARRGRTSFKGTEAPWPDFVESIRPHIESLVVSHRPEHKLSGQLHDETLYSEPYESGNKTYVHVRKPVDALTKGEVEEIVDPAVRAAVQKRLQELGDLKKLQTAGAEPPHLESTKVGKIPIRRVRIRKALSPTPVGEGLRQRQVAPGNNHHVEIVAELDADGKEISWQGFVVSRLEATQRAARNQPIVQRDHGEGYLFKFSLTGKDALEMDDSKGGRILFVVRTVSQDKHGYIKVEVVRHADARRKEEIKAAGDWLTRSPNELRKLSCRKVRVDLLGRVHPAND